MIKAIETRYKGYRFRSRLEARWAVFFDELGVRYEYEKEGYDLGELGWYLPDFWLPELRTWFEIKPLNEKPVVPKVYCAGRVNSHVVAWQIEVGARVYDSIGDMVVSLAVDRAEPQSRIVYMGPHLVGDLKPHNGEGFGQMAREIEEDDGDWQGLLSGICLDQIQRSDIVFAWLDDMEAYGTLFEIGYAKALGKQVWIGAGGFADPSELWFTLANADKYVPADRPLDAFNILFPWPEEMAKIHALIETDAAMSCIAYGDPVEAEVYVCRNGKKTSTWRSVTSALVSLATSTPEVRKQVRSMPPFLANVDAAAAAARAARFEHGQNGAR